MKDTNKNQQNNAIILFTRVPVPGQTKTRMMPYFSPEQCADFHRCCILDIAESADKSQADIIVSYTGGTADEIKSIVADAACYYEQTGEGLGEKMFNAFEKAFSMGYEKVVLVGTDVPELRTKTINKALDALDTKHIVVGPTEDGGYYLIGMKMPCRAAFNVKKYSTASVLGETIKSIEESGKSVAITDAYCDLDEPSDLVEFRKRMRRDARLRRSNTARYVANNTKVTIIVPTYNEETLVSGMVEQLRQYKDDAEIIFVDGGSTDRTVELIGDEFQILHSEKCRARQMNLGAEKASGDVLFFLHCDCKLPQNAIDEIRRCMASHSYGCFGVEFESNNFFMWTNKVISNHRARSRRLPFGDQGIFIYRKLFFDIGMFPDIPVMEDYEFSLRMKNYGYRVGSTANNLIASDRRYENGTLGILRTEWMMWMLRRKYRQGVNAEEIAEMYKDIR